MTFDTLRQTLGRQPVVILEIDLDYCTRTYGTAPCTASVGVTGSAKCYNTRRTCQDAANYVAAVKTYRFSSIILPPGAPLAIPSLVSHSNAPTVIDPAKSFGQRASVNVTLQDAPAGDFGIDKYVRDRPYDSATTGTFWGKLVRRNPYYNGRPMRLRVGYLDDAGAFDWANFQTYSYVIESIEGPDSKGKVRIVGKDILKLADDDRALVPRVASGKLLAAISAGATSATITPDDALADYPATGEFTVRIGDECMRVQRAGAVLTLNERGTDNTLADDHDEGDAVQLCVRFTDAAVKDVVYSLLTEYASIPASYIDFATWETEADTWLGSYKLNALLSDPMGVRELLTELTQQALFYIWWNERTQKIDFKAIRPAIETEITDITDDYHALSGSLKLTEKPDDRITQVWVHFGLRSPTDYGEKIENYLQLAIAADGNAEGDDQYGDQRIRRIYSRWFAADVSAVNAALLGQRLVYRYRNNPRRLSMKLDAKDVGIWTGDVVRVTSKVIQDDTGAALPTTFQVISINETKPGHEFQVELLDTFFNGRYAFITPNDMPVYAVATEEQHRLYGFISPGLSTAPTAALFADGTEAYKII